MDWRSYGEQNLPVVMKYDDQYENLSLEELKRLANENNPVALYEIASRYRLGEDVEVNREAAKRYYYDLLKIQKNTRAILYLGVMLKEEGSDECVEAFRFGSMLGDPDCSLELGYLYRYGTFLEEDLEEAIRLFELTDKQGYHFGLVVKGEVYLESKNYDKAYSSFEAALQNGEAGGALYLGKMYYWGMGVEESDEKAFPYLKRASDEGIKQANVMLGGLYGFGYGTERNVELALKCLDDVAEDDTAYAYNIKGRIYLSEGNNAEGRKWLEKSAELGDEDAQEMLQEGAGKSDEELAESGEDPYAMIRYSIKLMGTGKGGEETSLSKAVEVITRARQLYPDNFDVREQYAHMLIIRGYVYRQIGATEESYKMLRECIDEINMLRAKNYSSKRLDDLEPNVYMECGESAYAMNNDNVALEMFAKTDHNKYPHAVVLSALIHMKDCNRFASNLYKEISFLEGAVNSNGWRTDEEKAMAYYIISVMYANGLSGKIIKDVPGAYAYIKKCAEINSEMAAMEMKKYSKSLFGKIVYKG